jgi:hypothetical protein
MQIDEDIINVIKCMDVLYVDISPDDCNGIVVPRIAETENELALYKEKIMSREWLLKGIVMKEDLERMLYGVNEKEGILNKVKYENTRLTNDYEEEDIESPYCEVCGTCGEIGCCGIEGFINAHIKGKTNCKNEDIIIRELEDLCNYKNEIFEQNKSLEERIEKAVEYIEKYKEEWEEYDEVQKDMNKLLEILEKKEVE